VRKTPADLVGSQCLTCKCVLAQRDEQISHYKGDWHRYNLKLKLIGQQPITFEEFVDNAGKHDHFFVINSLL